MPDRSLSILDPREQVIAWLLEGHRDVDVAEAMRERWPDADHAQMLIAAVDHFEQAGRCDFAVVLGWGLEALKELYRRGLEMGDLPLALRAVKELVTLAGKHCVRTPEEEGPGDAAPDPGD